MIDWLIFAEKKDQATKFANGIFDKGKPTGSFTSGGLGGRDLSSVLQGEVRIVHFRGHIYEMKYPQDQDAKYQMQLPKTKNRFGMEVGGGYKSMEEMMNVYPIELNLNNIKMKLKDSKLKTMDKNMVTLYKSAKNIIVGTDFDNEGEMIFRNWQQQHFKNPNWSNIYRVKINVLTPDAVKKAFGSLISYDSNDKTLSSMEAQGFARSISDYEYGLSFSYYGKNLSNKRKAGRKGQFGRLKNSVLGIVYMQEKKHDDFVPTSKYRVDMVLPNGETLTGDDSLTFDTKQEAEQYINSGVLNTNVNIDYKESQKTVTSPKLFSRNELVIHLTKKYNNSEWNPELQSLYEKHTLMSYPRTDIQFISQETFDGLSQLVQKQSVQTLLNKRINDVVKKTGLTNDIKIDPMKKANKKHVDDSKLDGESHYALIPTEHEPLQYNNLTQREQQVYIEDLAYTMSMFANDSIVAERHYVSGEHFKSKQTKTMVYGYKLLTGTAKKDKDQFPDKGQYDVTYKVSEVKAKQPPLFTTASLLKMMKSKDWGTSATRESTVNMMKDKKNQSSPFIESKEGLRVKDELKPIVQELLNEQLIEFQMTSNWQKALNNLITHDDAIKFINDTRNDTKKVHNTFENLIL